MNSHSRKLAHQFAISLVVFGWAYSALLDFRLIAQAGRVVQEKSDYLIIKDQYSNYDYGYSVIPRYGKDKHLIVELQKTCRLQSLPKKHHVY